MRASNAFGLVSALLLGAGAASAATPTTEMTQRDLDRGDLTHEKVSIIPAVGVLLYENAAGATETRAAEGFNLNFNVTGWLAAADLRNWYLGLDSGFVFSHLGSAGSSIVGTSPVGADDNPGANAFLIPANLKVGYNFNEANRLSIHGGANLLYRSVASAIDTSDAVASDTAAFYPNVGLDYEVRLGRNINGLIRPDVTFTPGSVAFNGLIGVSFMAE